MSLQGFSGIDGGCWITYAIIWNVLQVGQMP
jgi:hypothetical protein